MNDFIIMTDSCCDLPAQLADKLELTVLPLSFTINGKEHYNYLDGIFHLLISIVCFAKERNVPLLRQTRMRFSLPWSRF